MRTIAIRLFVILLVLAPSLPAQVAPLSDADLTARAERFVDLLARGEVEEAAKGFDGTMKAAAPPAKLTEIWKALQVQLGPFRKRTGARVESLGGYRSAFVASQFEKSAVDLQVVFDGEGRIAGFFVKPAQAPASAPAYFKKDSFREKEVEVGSGEWAVPGTLSVPVGKGPFPAVVLVHGSGPNDRDETLGPNRPFRDLAWGLASRGIVVLRYEKRTRIHGDKLAMLPKPTVQEETVDDAVTAAQLLRGAVGTEAGIDPRRVFVLGHSLGGMLIPRIGARDAEIAGLVVLAGLTRPMEETIVQQLSYIASLDGTVSDEEKKRIDQFKEQAAKVKALTPGSPASPAPTESLMGIPASYWLDLRGYNPPEVAAKLRQPLLILHGERDYQVTMEDFQAWKKGLAERKNVTFKSYPNLNHLFMEGEGKATPAEYEKPGHVAAAVIEDIAAWIASVKKD